MSIFFDFKVGPTGRRFRRAVDHDVKDIEIFSTDCDKCLFGDIDIGKSIELSVLSICMVDQNMLVTGFMALSDCPNVPGVDPAGWEFWIRNMYQRYYLPRNTLFIHYMSCCDSVADYFLEEALVSAFMNDSYLLNIVMVVPPNCPKSCFDKYTSFRKWNFYRYYSTPLNPVECADEVPVQYLCVATRNEFCPRLRTRRAVQEDNDDLVNILHKQCKRLKELYGEYYISELLGRHPESKRKLLAAEYHERAVGIMCLNTDIDYQMLQSRYELVPYYGLRAASTIEKEKFKRDNVLLKSFGEPIMKGKWSPFSVMKKLSKDKKQQATKNVNMGIKRTTRGKINFKPKVHRCSNTVRTSDQSEELRSGKIISMSSYLSEQTNVLEADPFEYDIVNISDSLLSVPLHLSVDHNSFLKSTPLSHRASTSSIQSTGYPSKQKALDGTPRPSAINSYQKYTRMKAAMAKNKKREEHFLNLGGKPNAFTIELLALDECFDDRQAFSLLEASFEVMPNMEYCIIRTPCSHSNFSLLQHFSYVPPRRGVLTEYSLYIAHRSSITGKLRVRKAEMIDIPQISLLLNTLDGKETIWTLQNEIISAREHQVYIFLTGYTVVGVGILEPPEKIDFILSKYNMGYYHIHKYHIIGNDAGRGFAAIQSVIVHPAFEVHFRFFAREMMRLSGCNSLIWLTPYRNKWAIDKANSLAPQMVPLSPRKSEIDCEKNLVISKDRRQDNNKMASHEKETPFSTWFINRKISSLPKVYIDTKIVIVGASNTALGFLNSLLFSDSASYLSFTNVTLVSPNGLSYLRSPMKSAEMMFTKFRPNTDKFLKSTPYTYYVDLIHGTMVEINKQEKYIKLKNGCKCYYNFLLLLFGKQYQYPSYEEELKNKQMESLNKDGSKYVRLDVPRLNISQIQQDICEIPENVFIINHINDAKKAIDYVLRCTQLFAENDKVIVYGGTIEAYCCLASLIENKVPPKNIIFVEPFPPENNYKARVSVFANEYVDETIREVFKDMCLMVYKGCYFYSWSADLNNLATQIAFTSYYRLVKLECCAFFYYGTKGVDLNALTAMNASGMAYDGGVVIDSNFRTKDSAIYSAGPITRYCRRYYAQNKRHKHYDSYEIGEVLGNHIRKQLDPLFGAPRAEQNHNVGDNCESSKSSDFDNAADVLPKLKKPIVVHCTLPGPFQYLDVRSPGKKTPHHYLQNKSFNGHVIETFKDGYFKLHLNRDFIVDGITCLTTDNASLDNFKHIYGHSAAALKHVDVQYGTKYLNNLFKFFRSPWAFYLYHDNGEELIAMTRELLPAGTDKTIKEAIATIANQYTGNSPVLKSRIKNNFHKSPYIEAITDYVIQWLSENDVLLPMYLQTWQVADFMYNVAKNPYFKKKTTLKKLVHKVRTDL